MPRSRAKAAASSGRRPSAWSRVTARDPSPQATTTSSPALQVRESERASAKVSGRSTVASVATSGATFSVPAISTPNSTMPSATVPTAPMPVHTA